MHKEYCYLGYPNISDKRRTICHLDTRQKNTKLERFSGIDSVCPLSEKSAIWRKFGCIKFKDVDYEEASDLIRVHSIFLFQRFHH